MLLPPERVLFYNARCGLFLSVSFNFLAQAIINSRQDYVRAIEFRLGTKNLLQEILGPGEVASPFITQCKLHFGLWIGGG